MENKVEDIMQNLINQAKKNKDYEASYDLTGFASDNEQVRSFTSKLESKGLITDVSIYGKTFFSCKVTKNGFAYVEKESLNEN